MVLIAALYAIVIWLSVALYTLIVGTFTAFVLAAPLVISALVIVILAADWAIHRVLTRRRA